MTDLVTADDPAFLQWWDDNAKYIEPLDMKAWMSTCWTDARRVKTGMNTDIQYPHTDTRYPYTYASDYLRTLAGYGHHGAKLSRSDAGQIRIGIASALGMDDEELARKLADHYISKECAK